MDGLAVEGFTVAGLTVEGRAELPFRVVDAVPERSRKVIGGRLSRDVVVVGRTELLCRARRLSVVRFVRVAKLAVSPEFG